MTLVRDYLGFAVRFAGIGYVVLWPLAATEDGMPFGGAYVCGAFALLCEIERPLRLPHGIHALGALSAIAVIGMVALRLLLHLRRRVGRGTAVPDVRLSAAIRRIRRQPTLRTPRAIRPRSEFGLRRPP